VETVLVVGALQYRPLVDLTTAVAGVVGVADDPKIGLADGVVAADPVLGLAAGDGGAKTEPLFVAGLSTLEASVVELEARGDSEEEFEEPLQPYAAPIRRQTTRSRKLATV
jgi:hypothetical protein